MDENLIGKQVDAVIKEAEFEQMRTMMEATEDEDAFAARLLALRKKVLQFIIDNGGRAGTEEIVDSIDEEEWLIRMFLDCSKELYGGIP